MQYKNNDSLDSVEKNPRGESAGLGLEMIMRGNHVVDTLLTFVLKPVIISIQEPSIILMNTPS